MKKLNTFPYKGHKNTGAYESGACTPTLNEKRGNYVVASPFSAKHLETTEI